MKPPPTSVISIHALRKEGDIAAFLLNDSHNISIHALRKEGDSSIFTVLCESLNFYPRPPQGGRLHFADMIATHYDISIHALRKEGDAGLDAR